MRGRRRAQAALASLLLAVAVVAIAVVSTRTSVGAALDSWVRDLITNGLPADLRSSLDSFARRLVLVVPAPIVAFLSLLAVARRRWRQAAGAALVLAVPPLVALGIRSQELIGGPGGAFPSNHATVALALLSALLMAWPSVVATWGLFVAGIIALGIVIGNISWYAHAPRDVLGSVLLVGAVVAGVVAVFGSEATNVRSPRRLVRDQRRRSAGPPET